MSGIKIYKEDSEFAQKIQQIDELMSKLGITISYLGGGLRFFESNTHHAVLIDGDTHEELQDFPHFAEYKLKVFNSEY